MGKNTKEASVQEAAFLAKEVTDDAVVFRLGNGLAITTKVADLDAAMQKRAALHGISQKVGDAGAKFMKDKDFAGAYAIMTEVWDTLLSGMWSKTSRNTGGASDLAQAIANVKGLDIEAAREAVRRADEEKLKAWAKHPKIELAIAKIRAERAAAKVAAMEEEEGDDLDGIGDLDD